MSREFELSKEVTLEATPEQVWDAIATGPGITSWFMGPHTVEPGVGGQISMEVGDFTDSATVTAWDPPKHLAYRGDPGPDGSFHAMEYLVEGRDQGSTVLRFVHSGIFSPDWGDEFLDQTGHGWDMYLHTLGQYIKHFSGQYATYVYTPMSVDWATMLERLHVAEPFRVGDPITLTPEGMEPVEGVVDYSGHGPQPFLGVRGPNGLYRFFSGPPAGIGHHLFGDDRPWQSWAAS